MTTQRAVNYAIYFETAGLLKIGAERTVSNARAVAIRVLKKCSIYADDGHIIWHRDISPDQKLINETRLQAELSYILKPWLPKQHSRMSEWFETNSFIQEELQVMLKQAQANIDERLDHN